MSERDDGGPAFPFHREWNNERKGYVERETNDGVSIRDFFAAAALQGYRASLAGEARKEALHKSEPAWRVAVCESVAAWAYADADAMLKERAK